MRAAVASHACAQARTGCVHGKTDTRAACRRPYDDVQLGAAGQAHAQSALLADLRRRMLLVTSRLVTSNEGGMPAQAERVAALRAAGYLGVAQLLDIAAVYVLDNKALCQKVMTVIWDCDGSVAGACLCRAPPRPAPLGAAQGHTVCCKVGELTAWTVATGLRVLALLPRHAWRRSRCERRAQRRRNNAIGGRGLRSSQRDRDQKLEELAHIFQTWLTL